MGCFVIYKSRRISIFLESLDPGGIGRVYLLLAEEMAKQNFEIDLVLAKRRGEYLDQIPKNINIVDLNLKKAIFGIIPLARYIKKRKPVALIAAKERINIVALLAQKLSKSKTKLIISLHANYREELKNKGFSIYRLLVVFGARITYKWADRIVAVSEGVANDALKLFFISREILTVIYNPIVKADLKERMLEPVVHPWLNKNEFPVIVGMGRLTQQKEFSVLIKSFPYIKKVYPQAKMIIFGEGKMRKALENIIRNMNLDSDIDMPGFVKNPYSHLKKASVFVLSSAWEGFGNVLVEAMATGTPVVSTDCPSGPSEILDNGRYGPLVPVGNEKALADAILTVLKNPPDPHFLIERANDFSVDKAVDKYLQLIED